MKNYNLIIFFVLFNLLYGPRLIGFDAMMLTSITLAFLNIFSILTQLRSKHFYKLLALMLILIVFSLIHYVITGYADLTLINITTKLLVYFMASDFVWFLYTRTYYEKATFTVLRHIIYATVINSIFVLLAFFSSDFKVFIASIMDYERQLNWLDSQRRIFDISLGGGATASFTFFLVYLIGIFLPKSEKPKMYFPIMISIALATLLMGRTGAYFIAFVSAIYFLKLVIRLDVKVILNVFSVFFLVALILFLNAHSITESAFFSWASEGFVGENSTAEAISNMWLLPEGNFILGDGHFGRVPPNIIHSDIGYVRIFHGAGLVGLFILYGWHFCLVIFLGTPHSRRSFINLKILFYLIILFVFVMNLKELHFASRGTSIIIFLTLLSTLSFNKALRKEKNNN